MSVDTTKGQSKFGGWCSMPSPLGVEIMALSGFDWMLLDMQHGLFTPADLVWAMQILDGLDIPTLVRVPWNSPDAIMKALDSGASGVVVPMVNSAEEAEQAVRAARFPPRGIRSWGPIRPALRHSPYTPDVADKSVICAVQVETVEGVERLDEILAVPGVDLVYIGPSDLAVSAGMKPTFLVNEEQHHGMIDGIIERCHVHGVSTGIFSPDQKMAVTWVSKGVNMITVATDVAILGAGARKAVQELR